MKNNWKAGLMLAFAVASGSAAATPQAGPTPGELADFNNHSRAVVLQRGFQTDVDHEPLLIKQENGRYLVHEPNGSIARVLGDMGDLKSFSREKLIEAYGPIDKIRTFDQFKADYDVLKKIPGLGMTTEGHEFVMGRRIEDIKADMKAAGESFAQPSTKQNPAPAPLQS